MVKTKKKKKKNVDFTLTFLGEFVELSTLLPYSESSATETQSVSINTTLRRTGYLLDIDEFFYYLGESPTEIERAIRIDQVVEIAIVKVTTDADEILDRFDGSGMPEN